MLQSAVVAIRPHLRRSSLLVALLLFGCSRQDFRMVPRERQGEILLASRSVVDGHVYDAQTSNGPAWYGVFMFFLPVPTQGTPRNDAMIYVDEVVKGADHPYTIQLKDYRALTVAERALIPENYGFLNGLRLRIGYDRRDGNSLSGLVLCPLGLMPEYEEALRQSRASTRRAR
jgi:hypothetical protein